MEAAAPAPSQPVTQSIWNAFWGPAARMFGGGGSGGAGGSGAGGSGTGGSGGKGVKKTCQGCQFFLGVAGPTNGTHKKTCEHLKKFKELPKDEQRRFAQKKWKEKKKGG